MLKTIIVIIKNYYTITIVILLIFSIPMIFFFYQPPIENVASIFIEENRGYNIEYRITCNSINNNYIKFNSDSFLFYSSGGLYINNGFDLSINLFLSIDIGYLNLNRDCIMTNSPPFTGYDNEISIDDVYIYIYIPDNLGFYIITENSSYNPTSDNVINKQISYFNIESEYNNYYILNTDMEGHNLKFFNFGNYNLEYTFYLYLPKDNNEIMLEYGVLDSVYIFPVENRDMYLFMFIVQKLTLILVVIGALQAIIMISNFNIKKKTKKKKTKKKKTEIKIKAK